MFENWIKKQSKFNLDNHTLHEIANLSQKNFRKKGISTQTLSCELRHFILYSRKNIEDLCDKNSKNFLNECGKIDVYKISDYLVTKFIEDKNL